MEKIKFKPLIKGAKIGVVAPASPLKNGQNLMQLIEILKQAEFQVVLGESTQSGREGYLAGTDQLRKQDFENMWGDPTIDAIWCLRGGYGCLRLIADLKYSLIAENPKILIGFSDITALQLAVWSRLNLVSFHGPVLTTLKNEFSKIQAFKMITGEIKEQLEWTKALKGNFYPINKGTTQGMLLGGNLATLVSLIGTNYFPNFNDTVLFIEEVNESAYRIDRLLTQLLLCKDFSRPAAIMIGRSIPVEGETEAGLIEVFKERLSQLKIPIAYGYPIGHLAEQWTIPQGISVAIDTVTGQVRLLEEIFLS